MIDQSVCADQAQSISNVSAANYQLSSLDLGNSLNFKESQEHIALGSATAAAAVQDKRFKISSATTGSKYSPVRSPKLAYSPIQIQNNNKFSQTPSKKGMTGKKMQLFRGNSPQRSPTAQKQTFNDRDELSNVRDSQQSNFRMKRKPKTIVFTDSQLALLQQEAFQTVTKAASKPLQIVHKKQQKLIKYHIRNKSANHPNIQKSAQAVLYHDNTQAKDDIMYLWDKGESYKKIKMIQLENWKLKIGLQNNPRTIYSNQGDNRARQPTPGLPIVQQAPRYKFDSSKMSNPNIEAQLRETSNKIQQHRVTTTEKHQKMASISIISPSMRKGGLGLARSSNPFNETDNLKQYNSNQQSLQKSHLLSPPTPDPQQQQQLTKQYQRDTISW